MALALLAVWSDGAPRRSATVSGSVSVPTAAHRSADASAHRPLATPIQRPPLPPGVVDHGDVDAGPSSGSLAEVSIAIDRFRPDRVVAAAMHSPGGVIATMASEDGGKTWVQSSIPLSDGHRLHADPMVAFDSEGIAHLVHIPVIGGNGAGIEVNRSLDGGRTWSPTVRISDRIGDDKTILAVDDHPDSPFRDHVYVAWKLPSGGVFFSRSEDRGLSFSAPREISPVAISGLDLATSHDGSVFLVANSGSEEAVLLFRSLDGGFTFEPARRIAPVRGGWYTQTPSVCNRMSLIHASIGIGRSQGPGRGNLYVAWSDLPPGLGDCGDPCSISGPCTTDVFFSRSVDRGDTWSPPRVVHEADLGRSDQYHQWLEVDPATGAVYTAYKDTRDDPNRLSTHVYLNRSDDGGESFHESIRLSSAASVAGNSFQYGDYQGLAAASGRVYTAWADFRASSGASRIYVSRLDFPTGISVLPDRLDFGVVEVRRARTRQVVVTNHGIAMARISALRLRGAERADFRLLARRDDCSGALLAPGESCRFRVRFRPGSEGSSQAVVILPTNAPGQRRLRLPLTGTAVGPG